MGVPSLWRVRSSWWWEVGGVSISSNHIAFCFWLLNSAFNSSVPNKNFVHVLNWKIHKWTEPRQANVTRQFCLPCIYCTFECESPQYTNVYLKARFASLAELAILLEFGPIKKCWIKSISIGHKRQTVYTNKELETPITNSESWRKLLLKRFTH